MKVSFRVRWYFVSVFTLFFFVIFSFMPLSFYQSSPYTRPAIIAQYVAICLGLFVGYGGAMVGDVDLWNRVTRIVLGGCWLLLLVQLTEFFLSVPGPTFQTYGYFLLTQSIYLTLFDASAGLYVGIGCFSLVNMQYLSLNRGKCGNISEEVQVVGESGDYFGTIILPALCVSGLITALCVYIGYLSSVYFLYCMVISLVVFGIDSVMNGFSGQIIKTAVGEIEKEINPRIRTKKAQVIASLGQIFETLVYLCVLGLSSFLITTYQSEFTLYVNFSYALLGGVIFSYPIYRIRQNFSEIGGLILILLLLESILLLESLSQLFFMLRYHVFYQIYLGSAYAALVTQFFSIRIKNLSKGRVWIYYLVLIPVSALFLILMLEFGNDRNYPIEFAVLNSTYYSFGAINELVMLTRYFIVGFLLLGILTIGLKWWAMRLMFHQDPVIQEENQHE
jgi:hypothetical protein